MTIVLAVAALGASGLASCDDYQTRSDDRSDMSVVEEEAHAPAAEESAAPVAAPNVVDPTPTPAPVQEALPPAEKSSAQSVQPDSETLFY
nr:hypothetical protein [uncultured Brevundimonas sp.]